MITSNFHFPNPTTISTSKATDLHNAHSHANMGTLNQVTVSDSKLTSITIQKSKVINCTITRVTIHNSSISYSVLTNCRLYDCIIHSSKLYNCKLYGSQRVLRCKFDDCEFFAGPPTLSKLPVEIREMIFKLCLKDSWEGKAPNLLAALRGHKVLYFQALDVFQKTNMFVLNGDNVKLFKAMPETALSNIKKVDVRSVHIHSRNGERVSS
jgi:hypothetical protein